MIGKIEEKRKKEKNTILLIVLISLIGISFFFLLLIKDSPFSYTPTGKAVTQINVTKAILEVCNFTLLEGNNLISFHCLTSITPRDYLLESIKDNYTSIFAYNPNSADSWTSYNPNLPSWAIQDLIYIDNTKGYWVIMKNGSTFYHNGSVSRIKEISLQTSWNLIGYPRNTTENVGAALSSISGNYSIIMAYNASTGLWQSAGPLGSGTLTSMTPDRGYWIYMTSPDELNVTW